MWMNMCNMTGRASEAQKMSAPPISMFSFANKCLKELPGAAD